jgi:hypothetical protein
MQPITEPTTLRPVTIARLLERQGSPLAPLAEEIYDLAIAYRIDAAFALAQWMVESQLGCLPLAQTHRNAALVRVALRRLEGGALAGEPQIVAQTHSGDAGKGYVTYPGWLAGLEDYFRLLRFVFAHARGEEQVEQIAQAYLATKPERRAEPVARPAKRHARKGARRAAPAPGKAPAQPPPVSQRELAAYVRRIEEYRAAFQQV